VFPFDAIAKGFNYAAKVHEFSTAICADTLSLTLTS
jgi:hypothetical protein